MSRPADGAPAGVNGPSGRERTFWCALAVAVTLVLVDVRDAIDEAHVALSYLLIVLGASARGGRRLGLALAFLCFLSFNFFFLRPYHTLTVHQPVDWLVLLAFLAASAVATQLLHRAQVEAADARRRAEEIDRLAALGAETLNVARAEDAVVAIAQVMQSGLGVARCAIYLGGAGDSTLRLVAAAGAAEGPPDRPRPAPGGASLHQLLSRPAGQMDLPLAVRGHPVGVLSLQGAEPISLDPRQQRFAEALAYYAALALERVRLADAAAHADALREADRLKDALLASVSHDLRTPLTSIRALAQDMASEGDERAMSVVEEADRLNHFVSDLLDLSTLRAGDARVTPELAAAEDVLGAALQQVSGAAGSREIRAALLPPDVLLVGRFDFVHTLRSLVNLLENAVKYSPADTVIEVCARRDGAWIAFEVADRGPGIAPSERERVFEPFVRGARAADRGGTGLGLAIARRAAELQGGSLDYAPRPGGGALFTLRVPAAEAEELTAMSL